MPTVDFYFLMNLYGHLFFLQRILLINALQILSLSALPERVTFLQILQITSALVLESTGKEEKEKSCILLTMMLSCIQTSDLQVLWWDVVLKQIIIHQLFNPFLLGFFKYSVLYHPNWWTSHASILHLNAAAYGQTAGPNPVSVVP